MPKRKCVFNNDLKEQFPFLKESGDKSGSKVACGFCHAVFSIGHGGKSDITEHMATKKHKTAVAARSSSQQLTAYFKSGFSDQESELAAQEATMVFHTIKHNHSFQSMDCTSAIMKKFMNKKFTCAQTKCKSIIVNVFAPFAKQNIIDGLKCAKYCCLSIDSSNHIDTKVVPIMVRYFSLENGIQTEILEFTNLPGETSDILVGHVFETIKKHDIADKVIGISADNTNTNFGGLARKGKNNVFAKLKERLSRNIVGIGCAAHIIHNAVQTAVDILPVDGQAIPGKVYQYFHQFTVRVESLKSFCEFVDTDYKTILGFSKTRWLSLEPALNRFIEMYDGLKSYFLSQERCPRMLHDFFSNKASFLILLFLKTQTSLFSQSIQRIEREGATGFEVKKEIDLLVTKLSMRQTEMFLNSDVKKELDNLCNEGLMTQVTFRSYVTDFYSTTIQYIQEWTNQTFTLFSTMQWVSLASPISWENIIECMNEMKIILPQVILNEENLFDQHVLVKMYASEVKIAEWNAANCKIVDRWREMFIHFKKENLDHCEMEGIVSFCLTLPGSNASIERIFSLMNSLWTDERNRLQLDTVKSLLVVKSYFKNVSCSQFHELVLKDKQLLEKIHSPSKYDSGPSN